MAMASSVLCVLVISALVFGIAESSVVKEVKNLKQFNAVPGLTHITLAGAVQDGHKEVEAWEETVGPGAGTPIHRHDCEEILVILKGGGTVYIAPPSDNKFPGEPVATPFSANSTFSLPVNSVHQVLNTKDEDFHFFVIISKPPIKPFVYKTWDTPHEDAIPIFPIAWDKTEEATKDEL